MGKKKQIHRDMFATRMLKTIETVFGEAKMRDDHKTMDLMKYMSVLTMSMSLRIMSLERDIEECISKKLEWVTKPTNKKRTRHDRH